jgi:hypothetical protein
VYLDDAPHHELRVKKQAHEGARLKGHIVLAFLDRKKTTLNGAL